jgi:alpha-amylase
MVVDCRDEVQRCDLVGLPDLDTGNPKVRARIAQYINHLAGIGVAGLRIDAAKHIAAEDVQAILDQVIHACVLHAACVWVRSVATACE